MNGQSNLPPSAAEELVLKSLLNKETKVLQNMDEKIVKIREMITSAAEALDILTRSSIRVEAALELHSKHYKVGPFPSQMDPTFSPLIGAEIVTGILEKCNMLCPGHDIMGFNETNPVVSIDQLELLSWTVDNALKRQRLIINVNSCSIKLYSFSRAAVQATVIETQKQLSVIKRVPDEIWYEILRLRISKKSHCWPRSSHPPISLPALEYSHVCSSWRQIIFSSPSMWRGIHWNIEPDKEPNSNLIDLWLKNLPENKIQIYEQQSHRGLVAAGSRCMKLQLPVCGRVRYYIRQTRSPHYDLRGDKDSEINFPVLYIEAPHSRKGAPELQTELLSRFNFLESLYLQDVWPRYQANFPATITRLTIAFAVPHKIYDVSWLLGQNLEKLALSHFSATGTPILHRITELPNLRELDITPLEHNIVQNLSLPVLETLCISPMVNSAGPLPADWLASLIPHCSKVMHLEFEWSLKTLPIAAILLDRLQTLFKLVPHTPKLRTLYISSGFISGSALADFLSIEKRVRLEELTIDGCRGVSRMDCERLVELVDKLSVTRTVHGEAAGS